MMKPITNDRNMVTEIELRHKINQYMELTAQRKKLSDETIELLKSLVEIQKKEIDLLKQEIKQLKGNG